MLRVGYASSRQEQNRRDRSPLDSAAPAHSTGVGRAERASRGRLSGHTQRGRASASKLKNHAYLKSARSLSYHIG